MATKFFTNHQSNTLLQKFEGVLEHLPIKYIEIVVAYFKLSGYFRLAPHLGNVEQIRILVGIDIDKLAKQAATKGLEFNFSAERTKEEFLKGAKKEIQEAEYAKEVEEGVLSFIEDVMSGKVVIKAHPSKSLHSKIYILRPKNFNQHHSGSVITGSSNLTENGLERNFEFNVELRDYDDVAFALKTFEELWQEAIDITSEEVKRIETETYINDNFSPYEIYIKFLIEYFGKSVEYDPETDLPKGFMSLKYQQDAVKDGFEKLKKHNGFILADVVGLGKTIIATLVARKFFYSNSYKTKTLVVYPPALKDNWRKAMRDFDVPNVDFISNGSLHQVEHPEDYDLVIVDEAHKFRSDESEMFNLLQKICKTERRNPAPDGSRQKKVILVTATPLNNKPTDIRNQLYLFLDAKNNSMDVGNLQHFFRKHIERYERLKKQRDHNIIAREVKQIYDDIRVKVLEPIIVRRTRTDILTTPEYKQDIDAQGIIFPEIEPPRQILYQLDERLSALYDHTLDMLSYPHKGLGYFRYQAIKFLPASIQDKHFNKRAKVISEQLAKIIKTLLVKRLDSSFHAFRMSLKRYHDANKAMVKMIESNRVFIAPKLKVNELILEGQEEELEKLLLENDDPDQIQVFAANDFSPEFIRGVLDDQKLLESLTKEWEQVTEDPKFDEFIHRIQHELMDKKVNDNHKLLIFSESKETTHYLVGRLKEHGFSRILSVDSSNQKEKATTIAKNFDANVPISEQWNDYDIVVTTEVLAEGVNMHRCNVVVNYDIPWNATRLMQRIGRVNRIGTASSKVYIYNFFPTVQADNDIELNKKAFIKLQAFHSALGEDSQIYSVQEEYGTYGLFEKIPQEDRDERHVYLTTLRKLKNEEPELYRRIERGVPLRARCGRKDRTKRNTSLVYLKSPKRDGFYYVNQDNEIEELTFVEAARIFEAHVTERPISLHGQHHEQINVALSQFAKEENKLALGDLATVKHGPNDQKAIAYLNAMLREEFTNDGEKDIIAAAREAIKKGRFQKLPRELNQHIKELKKFGRAEAHNKGMEILRKYPLTSKAEEENSLPETSENPAPDTLDKPNIIISNSFGA